MLLSGRLFAVVIIFCSIVVLCENKKSKERHRRHFLALVGYYHGFKNGQNYAFQIPHFLIPPVIVIPAINQQQSINIQEGMTDENYQENGATYQTITNAKIISKETTPDNEEDIEIQFRHDQDNITSDVEVQNDERRTKETLRQAINSSEEYNMNKTSISTTQVTESSTDNTTEPSKMTQNTTTEATTIQTITPGGPYTTPHYNNDVINHISFTTISNRDNVSSSYSSNNITENFTLKVNISVMNNETMAINRVNDTNVTENVIEYTTIESTPSTINSGPYTAALYNNGLIDQLSITTNSFTNEESPLPPPYDDRWRNFQLLKNPASSGFKPLAGLYYDGFLHRPLRKSYGFLPYYDNRID